MGAEKCSLLKTTKNSTKHNLNILKLIFRNKTLLFGYLFLWRFNLRLRRVRWCFLS